MSGVTAGACRNNVRGIAGTYRKTQSLLSPAGVTVTDPQVWRT